ncbi:uncharacterized protein TOT_010000475 [Theileria orientalis strain Shintoku]|uniref:Uncharacterized protein n=1 Tax=Theileria orientalis strain Shintoku TaxID=869250 RepID=J4D5J7_THEOR|nr:uncharacterized protein TOT_010000475 [Theileria orientalis strain Shintoku]PVC50101.1 hypothetical protein MACL_00002524 [Theileria orientalis]BAM39010.1 uncharacterized protein TOT_010000475 [Theileria orientalis strain Shintoku]|eukprot:XP_009689311.1 uncharacterized protein TOT_010000475 [Theileria orientalis strain Shintoku]
MDSAAKSETVVVPTSSKDLDTDATAKTYSSFHSIVSPENSTLEADDAEPNKDLDPEKSDVNDEFILTGTTPTYIRHRFARKVFLTVLIQLIFTFSFLLTVYLIEASRNFFKEMPYLGIAGGVIFIVLLIALACKPAIARHRVGGVAISVTITIALTLLATTAACYYNIAEILGAMGTTLFVTLCLTIFAIQTKYDFTSWIGYLLVLSCCLLAFGIFAFLIRSTVVRLVVSGLGTLLVCFYIILDVQLIMGGKRKHQFSVDDYHFASIVLYSDIVTLFLRLLSLIGGK